ncbi:MAG: GNAT family N-acetyltransferase [Asticcacaulis sp.]|uniref:GNAT family N-acetyltransferase n=1 Tax=Asticcacaulis sp. TaxID=1872648 RepID=UPI0039E6B480
MTVTRLTVPLSPDLLGALHGLNEDHATELSSLTPEKLEGLIGSAFFAATVDAGDGLVIACDQDTPYDSPNFLWFRKRYPRFVYVDRVAVSSSRRGEGLARKLYDAVFAAARKAGHEIIVCEVNYDPPNPASDAFHEKLGFAEVGRAVLENGKGVRYLRLDLRGLGAATPSLS